MSNDEPSTEFWCRADEVIAVANKQCKDETSGKVSASLLYAAARFSSFNVASSANNVEEMKRDKGEAIKYFLGQFEKMLVENIEDYIENFERYTSSNANSKNT